MVLLPYKWVIDQKLLSDLEKIPKDITKRIIEKLDKAKIEPLRYFIKLKARTDYKLRVGDYRIIADINHTELKIEVTAIGHRRNIYKNF